jgi:hypothetical protein
MAGAPTPTPPTAVRRPWGRTWGNAAPLSAAPANPASPQLAPRTPPARRAVIARPPVIALLVALVLLAVLAPALLSPAAALAEPVLGVSESFWVQNWDTGGYVRTQATPRYVGEHVAVYVDNRCSFSEYLLTQLGTTFDATTYPVLTTAFGSEPNPGIDGDPRVAILIYDFNDSTHSIDGSFNYQDIAPQGSGSSNYREMFYLNLEAILAEPDNVGALAAHEFAHLILYYREVMLDPSPNPVPEELWVLEGLTSYAEHLAGYDGRTNRLFQSFMNDPSLNLTAWRGVRGNYGASYSFVRYLAEREGPDIIRLLANEPLDGIAGIDVALAATGSCDTFATVFDDWVVAAFLDNRTPVLPPYQFVGLSAFPWTTTLAGPEPLLDSAAVTNYGTLYLDFPAASPEASYQVVVDGADGAPLQAALISWDSAGAVLPSVTRFDLANPAGGDTITVPAGHDRHTLAVWARGPEGVDESYDLVYTGAADPPGGVLFLDMGGNDQTFYRYTAVLLERGVIRGKEIPSGSGLWFWAGRDNVTRAQFSKMIMLALGLHTEEIENADTPTFSDVPPVYDQYGYPYDYIEEAHELGVVKGYGDGTFGPSKPITRAHLVLMILRGAAAAGKPVPVYTGSARVFADVPVTHLYYREIMTAYGAGILSGSLGADGRLYFRPGSPAMRNHVAKMTAELIEHLDEAGS